MRISKNMVQRVISAVVIVTVTVGAFWAGGLWWQWLLMVLAVFMSAEWFQIIGNKHPKMWALFLGVFLGRLLFVFSVEAPALWAPPLPLLILMAVLGAIPALISQRHNKLICFLAGGSIVLPLLSLYATGQQAPMLLLWLVLVVWGTDTLAMVFGKTIGGRKLLPAISPQKTWAGLGGGMVGGLAATGGLLALTSLPLMLLLLAPLFTLLALGGDLLESALKRRFNVKESSHLIPGHGGFLDRMDSFILTAPALWLLLQFMATI